MKKVDNDLDELRPEYKREDFGPMVRGKYAARMKESTNIVVLDPDIADAFPNAEAVNQTLRRLLELAKAFDLSLECRKCKMSYFADYNKKCPYCAAPRPAFIRARTPRWEVLIPNDATECALPHRLFHPFSFQHNDDAECEAVPDFESKALVPGRGTKPFPDNLTFEFVEAAK